MEAYEFYATPDDGKINIPEQYRSKITSGVRVILLEENSHSTDKRSTSSTRKSDLLLPPTAKTTGWKFNREEANAR